MYSITLTLTLWKEVGLLALLGSGVIEHSFYHLIIYFNCAIVKFSNKFPFFFIISYNNMLMYVLNFIWAETIEGSW